MSMLSISVCLSQLQLAVYAIQCLWAMCNALINFNAYRFRQGPIGRPAHGPTQRI